jgi:uncharacterized protein (TIGR03437 family)
MKTTFLFLLTVVGLLAQNPPPHPAWAGDQVHEIRLKFQQPDYWEQLTRNYLGTEIEAAYLEASIEWGPYKFSSVGVRFKGNSSYRVSSNKKPFRIKLNEFVKGQKIEGIGAFNLSNGFMDASMVREPLYYEMSAGLGLKTPRTNYAALYINDQYWGLYVLGEVVNSDFLKNHFGSKEDTGNLYKGNIGAVFNYLGEDKTVYKSVWEKQTNEEADDWADLIELCRIVGQTPAAELKAKLEPIMDIDSFLTAIALDNATVNLDSYVGMGQNFNVYRRPSDNKWVWIVWDPSLAFGAFSGGGVGGNTAQLATEYSQTAGGIGGGQGVNTTGRPLATKLWAIPEYKERYRQIYKAMLDGVFHSERLIGRANAMRSMIRPHLEADPNKLNTMAQFDAAMTTAVGVAPGVKTLIESRLTWLKTQFEPQVLPVAQLTSSASSVEFATSAGTDPAAQVLELRYGGVNTPPSYSVVSKTSNGGNWLKLNVTSGGLPGSLSVSVDAKSLTNGFYEGSITAYLGGTAALVIPVRVTVGSIATPTVAAVVNAASYANAAIAPGQIVTLFGSGLGAAGLKVTFDGAAGQILYATATQIGVIAPLAISGKGETSIQAGYGTQMSAALVKPVVAAVPGIFTLSASGTGTGAIINQSGSVNGAATPAPKGSIIAIYLTGAGLANASGNIAASTSVSIGGQVAVVAFAGNAPGSVQGLYQVNATVPAGVGSGALPLVVQVGGVNSQAGVVVNVE